MLHNIQKQFFNAIFNLDESSEFLSAITEQGTRTAYDQFMSYRESVIGGIIEALAISYPVIKKLVGEDFFNQMTSQFIRNYSSNNPDLNNYGAEFSGFIDILTTTNSIPYLSDVAKLEWAWQKIINGSNTHKNNLHLLSSLNEKESENIIFQIAPHATLLHSVYPIYDIWKINQYDNDTEIKINNNSNIRLLIWRNEMNMNITPIEICQWDLLFLINQEIIFTKVCEEYNKLHPEQDVGEILSQCIQSAWVYSFKLS